MAKQIDTVTVEVVRNLLMSIAEETYGIIVRSAYSTNMKERRDVCTAVIDPDGNSVAQVESLAALLGSTITTPSRFTFREAALFFITSSFPTTTTFAIFSFTISSAAFITLSSSDSGKTIVLAILTAFALIFSIISTSFYLPSNLKIVKS